MTVSRLPLRVMTNLKSAQIAAQLDAARFGMPHDTVSLNGGEPILLDTFVKDQIRLYLATWVLGPLNTVVAWAEGRNL